MFMRFLSSAPLGMAVTASLLYLMNLLIVIGPGPDMSETLRLPLVFTRAKIDEHVIIDEEKPDPIDPPEPLPQTRPRTHNNADPGLHGISMQPIPIGNPDNQKVDFGFSDGPLANIIKVRPVYPAMAAAKGLSGFVIVQFDVTAAGTVANIAVIESSSSVFNKPAVSAVSRFRYKPRMIDGEAIPVRGLKHKFTFEMEG